MSLLYNSENKIFTIEGFSNTVKSDYCAAARGNGPIHHGNTTRAGVYILIRVLFQF